MNDTDKVMLALPQELRPNRNNLDRAVTDALAAGWSIAQITEIASTRTTPGGVVGAIKDLSTKTQPTNSEPTQWRGMLGPCRNNCDNGWHDTDNSAEPCRSCRPDTYRRWKQTTDARQKGATLDTLHHIWATDTRKAPTTYWTNH